MTETGSSSQVTSALNQALGKYKADLSQGQPATALKSLARQIAADAKLLGRAVSLPQAPALTTAPAAPDVSPGQADDRRLNTVA